MKKFMDKVFNAVLEFISQEGRLFRYSLSYCFLLALFPTLIVAVTMVQIGFVDMSKALEFIYQFIPKELLDPFIQYLIARDYRAIWSVTISLVVSCYMASNSLYSFMLISARHEEFKTYGLLLRIRSVIAFFLLASATIGVAVIAHFVNINVILVIVIAIFIILYVLYRSLSFLKRPWWYGIHGALFSSVAICVVGALFIFMVSTFTSYESIYGPLTNVGIMLLAIYIVSSIIYFGYCLNNAYNVDCDGGCYKNSWFFRQGNRILEKVEGLLPNK